MHNPLGTQRPPAAGLGSATLLLAGPLPTPSVPVFDSNDVHEDAWRLRTSEGDVSLVRGNPTVQHAQRLLHAHAATPLLVLRPLGRTVETACLTLREEMEAVDASRHVRTEFGVPYGTAGLARNCDSMQTATLPWEADDRDTVAEDVESTYLQYAAGNSIALALRHTHVGELPLMSVRGVVQYGSASLPSLRPLRFEAAAPSHRSDVLLVASAQQNQALQQWHQLQQQEQLLLLLCQQQQQQLQQLGAHGGGAGGEGGQDTYTSMSAGTQQCPSAWFDSRTVQYRTTQHYSRDVRSPMERDNDSADRHQVGQRPQGGVGRRAWQAEEAAQAKKAAEAAAETHASMMAVEDADEPIAEVKMEAEVQAEEEAEVEVQGGGEVQVAAECGQLWDLAALAEAACRAYDLEEYEAALGRGLPSGSDSGKENPLQGHKNLSRGSGGGGGGGGRRTRKQPTAGRHPDPSPPHSSPPPPPAAAAAASSLPLTIYHSDRKCPKVLAPRSGRLGDTKHLVLPAEIVQALPAAMRDGEQMILVRALLPTRAPAAAQPQPQPERHEITCHVGNGPGGFAALHLPVSQAVYGRPVRRFTLRTDLVLELELGEPVTQLPRAGKRFLEPAADAYRWQEPEPGGDADGDADADAVAAKVESLTIERGSGGGADESKPRLSDGAGGGYVMYGKHQARGVVSVMPEEEEPAPAGAAATAGVEEEEPAPATLPIVVRRPLTGKPTVMRSCTGAIGSRKHLPLPPSILAAMSSQQRNGTEPVQVTLAFAHGSAAAGSEVATAEKAPPKEEHVLCHVGPTGSHGCTALQVPVSRRMNGRLLLFIKLRPDLVLELGLGDVVAASPPARNTTPQPREAGAAEASPEPGFGAAGGGGAAAATPPWVEDGTQPRKRRRSSSSAPQDAATASNIAPAATAAGALASTAKRSGAEGDGAEGGAEGAAAAGEDAREGPAEGGAEQHPHQRHQQHQHQHQRQHHQPRCNGGGPSGHLFGAAGGQLRPYMQQLQPVHHHMPGAPPPPPPPLQQAQPRLLVRPLVQRHAPHRPEDMDMYDAYGVYDAPPPHAQQQRAGLQAAPAQAAGRGSTEAALTRRRLSAPGGPPYWADGNDDGAGCGSGRAGAAAATAAAGGEVTQLAAAQQAAATLGRVWVLLQDVPRAQLAATRALAAAAKASGGGAAVAGAADLASFRGCLVGIMGLLVRAREAAVAELMEQQQVHGRAGGESSGFGGADVSEMVVCLLSAAPEMLLATECLMDWYGLLAAVAEPCTAESYAVELGRNAALVKARLAAALAPLALL